MTKNGRVNGVTSRTNLSMFTYAISKKLIICLHSFLFCFYCKRSPSWKRLDEETKKKLNFKIESDGEFW